MSETNNQAQNESNGINPAVVVFGAIVIAAIIVVIGYFTFNQSKSAIAAREISKQQQAARKERANSQSEDDIDSTQVTTDSIDKQTQQIDQTLRSNDLGSGQVQADDLSDKGLGL